MADQSAPESGQLRGIEYVLAMAAVDDDFAEALTARRSEALAASGVELAETDRAVLHAVSPAALAQMVENLDGSLLLWQGRRAAMARLAGVAVAVLSGGLVAGQAGCTRKPTEESHKNPLAGASSPGSGPQKRSTNDDMRVEKRAAISPDAESKPSAPPKNTSPLQGGGGDSMREPPAMRKPPAMRRRQGRGWSTGKLLDSKRLEGYSDTSVTGVRPDRPGRLNGGKPLVTMGSTRVKGPMEVSAARRVLRRYRHQIIGCYQSGLRSNSKLKGTIRATLFVGTNGTVSNVRLASTMGQRSVENCVSAVLRRSVFPAKAKPSTITVPMFFKLR